MSISPADPSYVETQPTPRLNNEQKQWSKRLDPVNYKNTIQLGKKSVWSTWKKILKFRGVDLIKKDIR